VIEDHLRFEAPFSFRFLAKIDQAPGIEQRIGVAFKTARIPRQVDEQPVQNLFGIGAGRLFGDPGRAEFAQARSLGGREIEAFIGPV
jgi:hypothetical protein